MKFYSVGLLFLLAAAPASAQVDFSGEWAPRFHEDQPERVPGPELGDYLGLPINDAARLRADSWDASMHDAARMAVPPALRRLHLARAVAADDPEGREPADARDHRVPRRVAALDRQPDLPRWPAAVRPTTRCTAGAASPPAKWEGDMLTVTVTHLKEGYIRRNGLPRSDKATVTEHWMRHGDFLTLPTIVNDPVYLTEPFIRTTDYELDLHQHVPPYPCEMVQEIERPSGVMPHHLFGTNKDLKSSRSATDSRSRPRAAARKPAYPDYRKKLKQWMGPTPTAKFPGDSQLIRRLLRPRP